MYPSSFFIRQIYVLQARSRSGVPVRDIRFTLYPVGFIISAVFLAATLATSWLLPASHHVLHWRCQTHHVACLMLGDIAMAIIQLGGTSLQGEFCRILAVLLEVQHELLCRVHAGFAPPDNRVEREDICILALTAVLIAPLQQHQRRKSKFRGPLQPSTSAYSRYIYYAPVSKAALIQAGKLSLWPFLSHHNCHMSNASISSLYMYVVCAGDNVLADLWLAASSYQCAGQCVVARVSRLRQKLVQLSARLLTNHASSAPREQLRLRHDRAEESICQSFVRTMCSIYSGAISRARPIFALYRCVRRLLCAPCWPVYICSIALHVPFASGTDKQQQQQQQQQHEWHS
ncbi:unnamed protein product, partial [Trichogramma brassicae]